ncbi:3-deoxy-D-manno-octulosonic acid transferase [Constantimarinum furrinae]|uniref:3-deoxy-D-manno-octulosonic acid transferase n=1 Tax=Constantimarinum furrinae TaxID=2562285 RepID=A0A7G8PU74_9FLAO|nr:glycosyltransferase N-terminal domain-containing protein [Constantimarinum furrinae]QNJ97890.1 3-deoxy-D-manno-octulosonic acid transferase [Constantimarinum furrinae]
MLILYNFLTRITYFLLWIAQWFSKKLRLFVQGRKTIFETLQNKISETDKTIWFHCASLGEYEQGLPIMEAVKKEYPDYLLVLTFFSPSGYEIKKNTNVADVVTYLPMDSMTSARKFIRLVHPSLVFFVKYEFWPNFLFCLQREKIPVLLVSGLFRKEQMFFKPLGGFMRKALRTFTHLFVQDKASKELLESIGIHNVTVSGDTRFDRVSQQIERDNTLGFIEEFKQDNLCVVCGSTWPEDEAILLEYINAAPANVKFILAPHKIEIGKIENFKKRLKKPAVLYSEMDDKTLLEYPILIIDTIGLLSKIYNYADIAYVGGAMGTSGLHNILEPSTFGVPVIIGKNYEKFPEAIRLQQLAGLFSVSDAEECNKVFTKLIEDRKFRSKTAMITEHFVNSNIGATEKTMDYVKKLEKMS